MPPKKTPKIPKFPRRATAKLATTATAPTLSTPQNYLDQGVEEEESGDRWLISDLSKTLRFYQKAYEHYIEALTRDPGLVDAYYNANRLLYHIWSNYNEVPRVSLKSVEGCDVVNFGLREIKEKHEFIVEKFGDVVSWELFYNLALINTVIIEMEEELSLDDVLKIIDDSVLLLGRVLDWQLNELDLFLRRLEDPEIEDEKKIEGEEDDNDDAYDVVEQVTPGVVLETVVTSAKLIQAAYESCDNYVQLNVLKTRFTNSGFESRLQEVLKLLMDKFSFENNPHDDYGLNFEASEIEEVTLVHHSINAFFINDFDQLVEYWKSLPGLNTSPSRFMAEADSFQNFKDLLDGITSQQQWVLINHINGNLRKAQDLVKTELQLHITNKTNEVSSKASKIIEILISRADNELLRSSFEDLESSMKNREVLRQNTINLLKNGLNMSNINCGLRETISDRLHREKLKRECLIRLVVLTRDQFGENDLIRNLGADHYLKEVDDLKSNELYRGYF